MLVKIALPARSRVSALVAVAGSVLAFGPLAAQATNPPYLAGFPSVDRVKSAMQAKDPREQALRQLGAIWQLQEMVKQLSGSREFRGFLPDEQKLLGTYSTAHFEISKAIDSAFPGPYGMARTVSDNTPYRYMRTDSRFGIEGIRTFTIVAAPVVDSFLRSVGADKARWAARAKADSEAMIAAQNAKNAPPGARNDQGTLRIRRCVESGRSEMQCMMEGIGGEISGMMNAILPGIKKTPIQGIRMSGVYPGENRFGLTFYTDDVQVSCGELVPESHGYTTAVVPTGIRITIASSPAPIVLTLRPDGHLAGTGPTDIAGEVQTGVEYGTRTWSDGHTEPISRPVFAPRTLRCNIGVLTASGPSSPLGSLSAAPATLLNGLFGNPDPKAGKPVPVGARMNGEYGSQLALDLEFQPEGVVLGCREATSLRDYAVQAQGNQALIRVDNGGGRTLDFSLGPDGKITGSGDVRVDGRAVSGTSPNGDITYASRSATCTVGTLNPAGPVLTEAEQGAAAARQSLGRPAPSPAPQNTGGVGPSFVQLESGFPTNPNGTSPLAGANVMLLDGGFDAVLREAGVLMTPLDGFKGAFTKAYDAGGEKRQKLVQTLAAHTVGYFQLDKDGIGKSPELAIGKTNTFLVTATVAGSKYMWALAGVARAGWTKVILTTGNALRN